MGENKEIMAGRLMVKSAVFEAAYMGPTPIPLSNIEL